MNLVKFLCCALSLTLAFMVSAQAQKASLPSVKRILFLGDSITQDGRYVNYLETILLAESQKEYDIVNLGLSAETVSGLTEASEAKPRPVLSKRLSSVMNLTKPGLVFMCYGMNDGIYHPFSEARFDRFADGIERSRATISRYGSSIVHISPPVFDPLPIQSKLAPAGSKDFGYSSPSANYDKALEIYSDRLMHQRRYFGWRVINLHYAMKTELGNRRKTDPHFTFANDGVHPGDEGHWLMAQQILKYWGFNSKITLQDVSPGGKYHALFQLVKQRQDLVRAAYMNESAAIKLPKLEVYSISEAREKTKALTLEIEDEKLRLQGKTPAPRVEEKKPEVKPKVEEKKPAPAPKVEEKKPEVKPKVEEKKPVPAPKVEEKKPEPASKPAIQFREPAPDVDVEFRNPTPEPVFEF